MAYESEYAHRNDILVDIDNSTVNANRGMLLFLSGGLKSHLSRRERGYERCMMVKHRKSAHRARKMYCRRITFVNHVLG